MTEVEELQADQWENKVLKAKGPVVVDFWHPMCGWCLKLNPVFEQLPGKIENIKFAKINVLESAENRRIAMNYGVMGTPTMKIFCQGRAIGEVVGFRILVRLVEEISEILSRRDVCLSQSTPLKE